MLRWCVDVTRFFDCMNDSDLTSGSGIQYIKGCRGLLWLKMISQILVTGRGQELPPHYMGCTKSNSPWEGLSHWPCPFSCSQDRLWLWVARSRGRERNHPENNQVHILCKWLVGFGTSEFSRCPSLGAKVVTLCSDCATLSHVLAHSCTLLHTQTHALSHTHTVTHTHSDTHSYTHTHTNTQTH